jgi:hypothetical protein
MPRRGNLENRKELPRQLPVFLDSGVGHLTPSPLSAFALVLQRKSPMAERGVVGQNAVMMLPQPPILACQALTTASQADCRVQKWVPPRES